MRSISRSGQSNLVPLHPCIEILLCLTVNEPGLKVYYQLEKLTSFWITDVCDIRTAIAKLHASGITEANAQRSPLTEVRVFILIAAASVASIFARLGTAQINCAHKGPEMSS